MEKRKPEACVTMPYFEVRDGIYVVDEFDCGQVYVVVGEDKALLIDMGTGIGDLKWLVENKITDKPYEVVATHNHLDHIGGAGWFDSIWIHPDDMDIYHGNAAPSLEARKWYANLIRTREHKYYSYQVDADIREWPKEPTFRALQDGQVFDLGGRKVTAYHCPGHTAGEIVLIDDKTKSLLLGDSCGSNFLLNFSIAPTPRECIEKTVCSLKRIYAKEGIEYDRMNTFNFHHDYNGFGQEIDPDTMPNLIRVLENVLNKTAEYREVPDALSDCGATKKVAVYGNVQISCMGVDIEKI